MDEICLCLPNWLYGGLRWLWHYRRNHHRAQVVKGDRLTHLRLDTLPHLTVLCLTPLLVSAMRFISLFGLLSVGLHVFWRSFVPTIT